MCRGKDRLKLGIWLLTGLLILSGCGADVRMSDIADSDVASAEISGDLYNEENVIPQAEKQSSSLDEDSITKQEKQLEDNEVPLSNHVDIAPNQSDASIKEDTQKDTPQEIYGDVTPLEIPAYIGEPFVALNNNIPLFTETELIATSFEYYSPLDTLGRCGVTYACIGTDIMPTEERGNIGQIKPTGWHTIKYEGIDGNYLYNRCHLIGYQLTGENANEQNLITGTRSMNVDGMLPFENMVADYVKETGNHVLYRVTPIFDGENLVATGVQMEAMSVEDVGAGILFHVFVYNVQSGIIINYADGSSEVGESITQPAVVPNTEQIVLQLEREAEITTPSKEQPVAQVGRDYVLNKNTKKFHYPDCRSVKQMKAKNRRDYTGTREEVIAQGYDPCGNCNP